MVWVVLVALAACGDDLYDSCETADDCSAPGGAEAACVDDEGGGFCSWICDSDDDCDVDHDSELDYDICASFEENPDKYCFPACGDGDACPEGLECRSTGGGVNQRRVCFPSGGVDGEDEPFD